MEHEDFILGLFFSDENNLVFEKLKFDAALSAESKDAIKMLSFKFLGPIFMTSAGGMEKGWSIEFIEASLSLQQLKLKQEMSVLQSFFTLTSSKETERGETNLFALIGSPYTEDVNLIHDKMTRYIHPSILQGLMLNESLRGSSFNRSNFINEELGRGIDLIEYSLGASRKMYWEGEHQYYCGGLIERKSSASQKTCDLYTLDKDDPVRAELLSYIPSFYVMTILPDYYENLINETLILFNKKRIFSTIRKIELTLHDKRVLYMEEFKEEPDRIHSYGLILIPDDGNAIFEGSKNLSVYRKILRSALNLDSHVKDLLERINPGFTDEKWGATGNEALDKIRCLLDNR